MSIYRDFSMKSDSSHIGVGKNLQLNAQKCRFHAAILLFELYLEAV